MTMSTQNCFVSQVNASSEFHTRKGVPCHLSLVEALLSGITLEPVDKVLLVDCLPNRSGWNVPGLLNS